ncbi:HNH endonuclease [Paraburkholderia hospita]|uniref:HNH endonuclease n=1 Tax=Paraburkholderia hospita TaxID=169430 RepID=UPI003ED0E996
MPYTLIYGEDEITFLLTGAESDISSVTKDAMLAAGVCATCTAPRREFGVCSCDGPRVALKFAEADWGPIKKLLDVDLRRFNGRKSSELRQINLQFCPGFHRNEDRGRILQIQDRLCYFCGVELAPKDGTISFERDHLTPVSRGGSEWPSNLAMVCKTCNGVKGAQDEKTFWNFLKNRNGAEWVAERKRTVPDQKKEKKRLTRMRQNELRQLAIRFEEALKRKVEPIAPELTIQVVADSDGLTVEMDHLTISLLPFAHRRLEWWLSNDQIDKIAASVANLAEVLKP